MHAKIAPIVLLSGLLLAGCGDSTESPKDADGGTRAGEETFDVLGTIAIPGGCGSQHNGYYPDIQSGAQVTVLDADSTPVALGTLAEGTDAPSLMGPCTFAFEVEDVPAGDSSIYSLSIGTRQPYQFKQADAGALTLSLGE